MHEAIGALCARNIMAEGAVTRMALINAIFGLFLMQASAYFFNVDIQRFHFVFFKFVLVWVASSLAMGALVYIVTLGKFTVDHRPASRAWPNGPHLNPLFRVIRDLLSSIIGIFIPTTDYGAAILYELLHHQTQTLLGFCAMFLVGYFIEDLTKKNVKQD